MRYCGILALPRAVLQYSYPPYAPLWKGPIWNQIIQQLDSSSCSLELPSFFLSAVKKEKKSRYFYSFEVLVSFINFVFNSLKRFSHGTSTDCFSLHHSGLKNLLEEGEEMTNWTHMASTPGVVPRPHGRRQVTTALLVISTGLPGRRSRAQTLPGQTLGVLK